MTALQLIQELSEIVAKYGDLPVNTKRYDGRDGPVGPVHAYDNEGNTPRKRKHASEIYLHT